MEVMEEVFKRLVIGVGHPASQGSLNDHDGGLATAYLGKIAVIVTAGAWLTANQIEVDKLDQCAVVCAKLLHLKARSLCEVRLVQFGVPGKVVNGYAEAFQGLIAVVFAVNVPGQAANFQVSYLKERVGYLFQFNALILEERGDGFLTDRSGQDSLIAIGSEEVLITRAKGQFIVTGLEVVANHPVLLDRVIQRVHYPVSGLGLRQLRGNDFALRCEVEHTIVVVRGFGYTRVAIKQLVAKVMFQDGLAQVLPLSACILITIPLA